MQSAAGQARQLTAFYMPPSPQGRLSPAALLRISQSAEYPQVNIIYRDCVTGRLSPPVFASHTIYIMFNLLCHSILYCCLMPLSSRWQLWVRGREGPPLPQSALPGPRAYEYQRYSSYNRQWSATVLTPLMARGPPRSNVRGMRLSSLASPFNWMRASCHLRTSCRVGIGCDSLSAASLWIKSQEPSLLGKVYIHPRSPLIGGKAVFYIAVCYSAKGGQDSQRNVCVRHAIRRCGQFSRYAETVRIPLVPRSSVQTLLRSTAFRGVI